MKKTILLLALCLFAFTNIQTSQAQTKEETIAWIKEKLQKTPADGRSPDGRSLEIVEIGNISITPCRVSYYYIVKDIYDRKYANAYYLHEVSFPTYSIVSTGEDYFGLGAVSIGFDAKAVEEKIYTKYGRLTEYTYWKTNNNSHCNFVKNTESNLVERMGKALNHLTTFCEKKKETF